MKLPLFDSKLQNAPPLHWSHVLVMSIVVVLLDVIVVNRALEMMGFQVMASVEYLIIKYFAVAMAIGTISIKIHGHVGRAVIAGVVGTIIFGAYYVFSKPTPTAAETGGPVIIPGLSTVYMGAAGPSSFTGIAVVLFALHVALIAVGYGIGYVAVNKYRECQR